MYLGNMSDLKREALLGNELKKIIDINKDDPDRNLIIY